MNHKERYMSEKFNYLDSTSENAGVSEKHKNFIKIGIVLVLALGFGAKTLYNNHIEKQDAEIAQKEEVLKATPISQIKAAMQKERNNAQEMNAENLVLISKYTKYPELIKLLKYNNNLASHMKNNTVFLQNVNNSIAADEAKIEQLQKALNRDEKVSVFLNGDSFSIYNKWLQSMKANTYVYSGQLNNLNNTIAGEIKILESTQQEIMKTVRDRIKAKDFSLDAAQASFASDLRKEKEKEISELTSLKKELEGTEESGSFTTADMQSVTTDLNQLEDETMAQIKQDREKLDKLLAENGAAPTATSVAANTAATQQTNQNSNSFPTYLLMYHWMMSGSNYNAGYNAGMSSAVASSFRSNAPYSMNSMQNSGASSAAAVKAARIRNNVANATQRARASVARANSARIAKANAARSSVSSSGFGRSGGMSSGS